MKKVYDKQDFVDVADAIRAKTGKSAKLEFPDEFISEIEDISGDAIVVNSEPDESTMVEGKYYIIYQAQSELNTRPSSVRVPPSSTAGQNGGNAVNAFNYNGALENVNIWSTNDNNFTELWIAADYGAGSEVALNMFCVAPRTFSSNRQIYTAIIEASNDGTTWTELHTSAKMGNQFAENKWTIELFNNTTAYRFYRLRTTQSSNRINGSATFTLQGLGFGVQDSLSIPTATWLKSNGIVYKF